MHRGLLEFDTPPKLFQIGNVNVGGQRGVYPTVLIGSIFYHRHNVVVDAEKGELNKDAATAVIRLQEEWAQKTGNPGMLDVVGASPMAMKKNLAFAAGATTMPLLIDGTTPPVRLAGLEAAAELGITERVIYNSITPEVTDEEFHAIQRAGVKSALILTYYMQDFTGAGRVQAVRELLPRCRDHGIDKLIVDTCVLDLASLGEAMSAMHMIKQEMGLPVGGGVHNAVAVWKGLKTKMGKQAKHPCLASVCAAATAIGADFVLYGPVEDAQYVFPAVAMIDTAYSQIAMERDMMPVEGHPRSRIG